MGIFSPDLLQYVIRPTLERLGEFNPQAQMQLLLTAACESNLGEHIQKQSLGFGLYRISAKAHQQHWDEYLAFKPDLASDIRGLASQHEFLSHPHLELTTNLSYATAIAYSMYQKQTPHWPKEFDLIAMATLWATTFDHPVDKAILQFKDSYQLIKDQLTMSDDLVA
jgi:hypothetical protein